MSRNVPFLLHVPDAREQGVVNRLLWAMAARFRRKRFRDLKTLADSVTSIIDFGGTPAIWESIEKNGVVLLNIDDQSVPSGFVVIKGDGRKTNFTDEAFGLAFSNSVIEHVGTWEDQKLFARELSRVGRRVYR
jgi:hypothetical protein